MIAARVSRLAHRWLALLLGVQLVAWTASGVYMTAVDLDFIHGDSLVRNLQSPLDLSVVAIAPAQLLADFPGARRATLRALPTGGRPVYEIDLPAGITLVDARTGRVLSPLREPDAADLARAYYAGTAPLRRIELIESDPPIELQARTLPLWRADFDDWLQTSLYVDPATGRLVVRRHRFWRWFDLLWSLHIMDYVERSDVNNTLLRVTTGTAAVFAASGLWLVAYSFRWRRTRRGAKP
jgi:hypothetical protein